MSQYDHLLKILNNIQQQIDEAKNEIQELQSERELEVEIDLLTGLPIEQDMPYIPPITVGEEIMGGEETDMFPDCCAVGNEQSYTCSGTLIAPNVVVTAAHCGVATRVFLRGNSIFNPSEGEMIPVAQRFFHNEVDLMVLLLEHDSTVSPRHIAQGQEIYEATVATAAGFGTIDIDGTIGYGTKRFVHVPIMSMSCDRLNDPQNYGCIHNKEMVAGHLGLHRDSCRGDSGGPLYITAQHMPDVYYLLGVTSRGTRNGFTTCGDGGIYVRVDLTLDWIRQVTGVNIPGPIV